MKTEFFSNLKKYKKYFKTKYRTIVRYSVLLTGNFGILCKKAFIMELKHFKICFKTLKWYTKKLGLTKKIKIICRVFPDKIITQKPKEIRMGRGKGLVSGKIAPIKGGTFISEFIGVTKKQALCFYTKCIKKLPSNFIFIEKKEND